MQYELAWTARGVSLLQFERRCCRCGRQEPHEGQHYRSIDVGRYPTELSGSRRSGRCVLEVVSLNVDIEPWTIVLYDAGSAWVVGETF